MSISTFFLALDFIEIVVRERQREKETVKQWQRQRHTEKK